MIQIEFKKINNNDLKKIRGMRNIEKTPLTEAEVRYVLKEIIRIEADPNVFVFNDPDHIDTGTGYNFIDDKVYISRNVFPNEDYISYHPRDRLTVAAVLAHEYYGHRPYRQEYIEDYQAHTKTTPEWEDECRASINAAKFTPNLKQEERAELIAEAGVRAEEFGQILTVDKETREIMYGKYDEEKRITAQVRKLQFVELESEERLSNKRTYISEMPEL